VLSGKFLPLNEKTIRKTIDNLTGKGKRLYSREAFYIHKLGTKKNLSQQECGHSNLRTGRKDNMGPMAQEYPQNGKKTDQQRYGKAKLDGIVEPQAHLVNPFQTGERNILHVRKIKGNCIDVAISERFYQAQRLVQVSPGR
jgi:hypothetical protein